jgi:hypothetical protein
MLMILCASSDDLPRCDVTACCTALAQLLGRLVDSLNGEGRDRYNRRGVKTELPSRPQGQQLVWGFDALYQLGGVLQDMTAVATSLEEQKAAYEARLGAVQVGRGRGGEACGFGGSLGLELGGPVEISGCLVIGLGVAQGRFMSRSPPRIPSHRQKELSTFAADDSVIPVAAGRGAAGQRQCW